MNFIKKIFAGISDEAVHKQFVRFGKGIYRNRCAINFSYSAGKIKLGAGFEFANDLIMLFAELAKKFHVNGVILFKGEKSASAFELDARKKGGIWQTEIDKDMTEEEINKISKDAYIILLDCSAEGMALKMKKKLPQPSKSGKEKADDKFCILEAEQHIDKIKEDFLFDVVECKKAKIIHEFIVKDVILPKEKINDFEKLRMLAKKKIEVVRKVNANCKQSEERKEVVV